MWLNTEYNVYQLFRVDYSVDCSSCGYCFNVSVCSRVRMLHPSLCSSMQGGETSRAQPYRKEKGPAVRNPDSLIGLNWTRVWKELPPRLWWWVKYEKQLLYDATSLSPSSHWCTTACLVPMTQWFLSKCPLFSASQEGICALRQLLHWTLWFITCSILWLMQWMCKCSSTYHLHL